MIRFLPVIAIVAASIYLYEGVRLLVGNSDLFPFAIQVPARIRRL